MMQNIGDDTNLLSRSHYLVNYLADYCVSNYDEVASFTLFKKMNEVTPLISSLYFAEDKQKEMNTLYRKLINEGFGVMEVKKVLKQVAYGLEYNNLQIGKRPSAPSVGATRLPSSPKLTVATYPTTPSHFSASKSDFSFYLSPRLMVFAIIGLIIPLLGGIFLWTTKGYGLTNFGSVIIMIGAAFNLVGLVFSFVTKNHLAIIISILLFFGSLALLFTASGVLASWLAG